MVRRTKAVLAAGAAVACLVGVQGFTGPSATKSALRQETALNAAPPMIIGPMIRKMREEQEKKKMPMASDDEQRNEAPGLRVGGNAWKWPPVWPYDQEFFTPKDDIPKPDPASQLGGMAGMLGGGVPPTPAVEDNDIEKLNPESFWSEEKGDVKTELDEEAAENLRAHLSFYMKPESSILEFGAAEESYLSDEMKPSRHVGVSLSPKLMDQNPSLTEKLVVDLNNVVPERDVDSDELRRLASDPFDYVIMTNTVDFLTHPREVFRSAFNLLKPGGTMFVAFTTNKAYPDKFGRAMTKMWKDFNDDQHMWICGSMFQFSAGDGWESLKGFDISPDDAKDYLDASPLAAFKGGKDNNMFVVQATRGKEDDDIDEESPEKSIKSKMWMMPTMEERDKQLVVPRLARAYTRATSPLIKDTIKSNIAKLPKIYESLVKMDQFAFTFQMQSQLAADLVINPMFNGNDDQLTALKQGLGLRTPSPEFWQPLGEKTGGMVIEDKINLLAHLVAHHGSGDAAQDAALIDFADGLEPTFALIRSKCPDLSEDDVQLLGTELLCSEILIPGRSTKEEYAKWLGSLSSGELEALLAARKIYTEQAKKELNEYREALAVAEREQEKKRKEYEEQVKKAREERSMAFNPKTGKFQEINKEKKK